MAGELKVVELGPEVLNWEWEGKPYLQTGRKDLGDWLHTQYVDPTPGYRHELGLVRGMLEGVAALYPVGWPVTLYNLSFDTPGRTNGWTEVRQLYYAPKANPDDPSPYAANITLGGKRIPLHPAMTRYLVAHEYGHVVERWIAFRRGEKVDDHQKLLAEYRTLRGLPEEAQRYYGPGTWHKTLGEVFANDFRILICDVESEFWPHEVPHPTRAGPELRAWWDEALKLAEW